MAGKTTNYQLVWNCCCQCNNEPVQFKDFLQLFNVMSESCFYQCVHSFNRRDLTDEEAKCVSYCTDKYIRVNNRIMELYMEVQPQIIKKRVDEMEAAQLAKEKSLQEVEEQKKKEPAAPES